ncbi:hypothetical protein EVAR_35222_1 [Eumeta japonica]|uniref:Uncharacterized protein n=1 Tax=Eumeta variegata TaxID=151549 RepID=A0A4C1VBW5_EUMVA|nr:hypothetical protein EVAR_35222_1 [Eumeta japonica]
MRHGTPPLQLSNEFEWCRGTREHFFVEPLVSTPGQLAFVSPRQINYFAGMSAKRLGIVYFYSIRFVCLHPRPARGSVLDDRVNTDRYTYSSIILFCFKIVKAMQ